MKKKNKSICDIYFKNSSLKTIPGYVTDVFRYDKISDEQQTKIHVYHLATKKSNGTTTYYPKGYEITGKLLVNSYEQTN